MKLEESKTLKKLMRNKRTVRCMVLARYRQSKKGIENEKAKRRLKSLGESEYPGDHRNIKNKI